MTLPSRGPYLISLAEQRVHARPTSDEEAREALQWLADREGKTFVQLMHEIHGSTRAMRPADLAGAS